MILGTPSRNDWIQNLSNFRSNFAISPSDWISSEVFNSTQFMGWSLSSGFRSHTSYIQNVNGVAEVYTMRKCPYLPASTSPPRITEWFPNPVCTTEQYCCMLSTTCRSLDSINSRETSSHMLGINDSVSNLYPQSQLDLILLWNTIDLQTPIAHEILAWSTWSVWRPPALLLFFDILSAVILFDISDLSVSSLTERIKLTLCPLKWNLVSYYNRH